ncbi:MAG: hypothetical protein Q4Q04_04725 [Methanocorpusculum sp.]|nr:hypothetical protein [Methanocorpusculum sp.]
METSTTPDPSAIAGAMELFNAAKYDEVIALASGTTDPALMLLAARSYIATGKTDIAESLLRSLLRIMPGSSCLHSYLADILEQSGREGAAAEYSSALNLDPENKQAVRSYAALLLKTGDLRGAIPALRSLVLMENNPDDIRLLESTLTKVGEPKEAVALHIQNFGEGAFGVEYIEALIAAKEYQKALSASLRGWNETKDTAYLRLDLEALASIDRLAAEKAYRSALDSFEEEDIADENVTAIRFSFVLLEKLLGNTDAAKYELSHLLTPESDIIYHLLAADMETRSGNGDAANSTYRALIARVCEHGDTDWDAAELVIDRFVSFLSVVRTKEEVAGVISVALSPYPAAVCLVKIAEAYEAAGSATQAKDWYYRAYRADFIKGGIAYAGFLRRTEALRECETVIRYIFTNAVKISDIELAADAVLNGSAELYRLAKTRELVLKKLSDVSDRLTSRGREMLSSVYLYAALDALECRNYEDAKWFCLAGIDVLPCYPDKIHIQDFSDILARAKGRALAERPVLLEKVTAVAAGSAPAAEEEAAPAEEEILPNLDDRERKLLAFLREHREATEMDLRAILDTRRVAGIVNALAAKTAALGITLIEKRGVGDRGEVYGYAGRR